MLGKRLKKKVEKELEILALSEFEFTKSFSLASVLK